MVPFVNKIFSMNNIKNTWHKDLENLSGIKAPSTMHWENAKQC
jgi:hypothetical protein